MAETDGGEDVLVVELFDPTFDEGAGALTYGANVLRGKQDVSGLAYAEAQQHGGTIAAQFTHASLFIDDCADRVVNCYTTNSRDPVGSLGTRNFCWTLSDFACTPCNGSWYGTGQECNQTFPACANNCFTNPA